MVSGSLPSISHPPVANLAANRDLGDVQSPSLVESLEHEWLIGRGADTDNLAGGLRPQLQKRIRLIVQAIWHGSWNAVSQLMTAEASRDRPRMVHHHIAASPHSSPSEFLQRV